MEALEYWKKRCELAEKFINESPDDPDVTEKQANAYWMWIEFKKISEPQSQNTEITEQFVKFLEFVINKRLTGDYDGYVIMSLINDSYEKMAEDYLKSIK